MLKWNFSLRSLSIFFVTGLAVLMFSCAQGDDEFPDGGRVTNVELSVDTANFTGTCPKTLKFTGVIATNGTGQVSYIWERSSGNSSSINANVPISGGILVTDEVVFATSGSVTIKLHVTEPNDITSNTVTATATCT